MTDFLARRRRQEKEEGAKHPRKLDFCPAIAFPLPPPSSRDALKVSTRLGMLGPVSTPNFSSMPPFHAPSPSLPSPFSLSLSSLFRPPSPFLPSPADLAEIAHRGRISAENLLILQQPVEARDTKSHSAPAQVHKRRGGRGVTRRQRRRRRCKN